VSKIANGNYRRIFLVRRLNHNAKPSSWISPAAAASKTTVGSPSGASCQVYRLLVMQSLAKYYSITAFERFVFNVLINVDLPNNTHSPISFVLKLGATAFLAFRCGTVSASADVTLVRLTAAHNESISRF
jgi:hypothetical protein